VTLIAGQYNWSAVASFTPQYAQAYDNFAFRVRSTAGNQSLYLGLRIDGANLSRVLK
jgi:hypothetical protein